MAHLSPDETRTFHLFVCCVFWIAAIIHCQGECLLIFPKTIAAKIRFFCMNYLCNMCWSLSLSPPPQRQILRWIHVENAFICKLELAGGRSGAQGYWKNEIGNPYSHYFVLRKENCLKWKDHNKENVGTDKSCLCQLSYKVSKSWQKQVCQKESTVNGMLSNLSFKINPYLKLKNLNQAHIKQP